MANKLLTDTLSEPLNGAQTAKVTIDSRSGNLTIGALASGEPMLASGTLEYYEKQGRPSRTVSSENGQATLTVRAERDSGRACFRFPWETCNGANEWRVRLNPGVPSDISAHSGGGNVKLDLAGMAVTGLAADTGGGNMDVTLPDKASDLCATVKAGAGNVTVEIGSVLTGASAVNASSGAGNVAVCVPAGLAARVHATTGMGKVIVDPRFSRIDKNTYQSPDYDGAADRVEIMAKSGAGNVSISTK